MDYIERIKDRYRRKVIAHPEGTICHDGDCRKWDIGICTCGLLHDLISIIGDEDKIDELYPEFWKEQEKQDGIIYKLMEIERKEETNGG